jgi:hypothetical protein
MRVIKRLPLDDLKAHITRQLRDKATEFTAVDVDSLAHRWKRELEEDPFASLDPVAETDGEFKIFKGFSRETGLYVASLTGSFVYTSSDTQWTRLHQTDGVHSYEPDPRAAGAIGHLENIQLEMPSVGYELPTQPILADASSATASRPGIGAHSRCRARTLCAIVCSTGDAIAVGR